MTLIDFENQIPKGWECPKCGRVYSPSTPMCFTCVGTSIPAINACNQFIADTENKSSGLNTRCMNCGKEKWEHRL